jgi:hypothetical protein
MSNYDNLLRGKENEMSFDKSQMEKHWESLEAKLDAKLIEDPQKSKGKSKLKNIFKIFIAISALFIVGLFTYKNLKNKKSSIQSVTEKNATASSIKPPKPLLNIPYEIFTYDATMGDTIFTKNGSILIFPKNAVLNSKGEEIVTGMIEVRTREFNDGFDYYMAGIPMTYDSAGVKYTFVSSGMIDIKAYQNNELLYVNPKAKPQLNLISTNKEKNTNLYQLDTTTGQWANKGKDVVNDLDRASSKKIVESRMPELKTDYQIPIIVNEPRDEGIMQKPIPPQKASGKNPVIEIQIDPASFRELMVYNNLKFEVIGGDKWNENDSRIEWANVKLDKNIKGDYYTVKFSTINKSVSYVVKPVLENDDYDKALQLYNEKLQEYNKLFSEIKAGQLTKDNKALVNKELMQEAQPLQINEANTLQTEDTGSIAALKKLIALRNQELMQQQVNLDNERKKRDDRNKLQLKAVERYQQQKDSIKEDWEKVNRTYELNQNLLRTFQIDGFGYWNCDVPTMPNLYYVNATFKDDQYNIINLIQPIVVVRNVNRIVAPNNFNIGLAVAQSHAIFGFANDQFYYLPFEAYDQLKMSPAIKNYTFMLREYNVTPTTFADLKQQLYQNILPK